MGLIYFIGFILAIWLLSTIFSWHQDSKKLKTYIRQQGEISTQRTALLQQSSDFIAEKNRTQKQLDDVRSELDLRTEGLKKLASQKSIGSPYLAEAWSDFLKIRDDTVEAMLKYKKHPAAAASQTVREYAGERRAAVRLAKIAEYKLKLYEALFSWIKEFAVEGIDDAYIRVGTEGLVDEDDPAANWLPEGEYKTLPPTERNQRALTRYCNRRKTNWEIGRDYERYVGHLYETKGHRVEYFGALEGFDDLGRDLLVRDGDKTLIVQCKYWADFRVIHEKHLFQLFGTSVEFALRQRLGTEYNKADLFGVDRLLESVKPVFYTSTQLSDRSRAFAKALEITVFESFPMPAYPMIKCNVAKDGARIYHLPFDQQYDRVRIIPALGEYYVSEVREAEKLGFRRAFRWRGAK